MSSQSNINNIIINQLSESKYNQITPEEGEFYCTPDTNIATKDWTESRINDIMDSLYPVGSTYITTASTCPLATLISGSTWALVSSGRVLQGADSGHAAGTTIEAGLPNITGGFGVSIPANHALSARGSFTGSSLGSSSDLGMGGGSAVNNTAGTVYGFDFYASRSSSIYGSSSTVQPPAYVVNIFQRTA